MEAVAYVDGASLANPGSAALAVRLYDMQGRLLQSICEPIGKQTNNFAEYYALLRCLQEAHQKGITRLTIYTDSELLVKQWSGDYRVLSDNLKPLYREAQEFRE
ncbi:MAG: ribonuclease HI family protein, partial [Fimbriimonadales bacterium]